MKILVTGATGFVGTHVVEWLVDHGYEVIATSTSDKKARDSGWYTDVLYMPCDYVRDDLDYYTYFNHPDIVIHLGWKAVYNNTVSLQLEMNLPRNIHFLQNFIQHNVTKIVGLGSFHEYGGMYSGCLSETMISNPITPYAVAKDAVRRYVELAAQAKGIHWNWIRQFHLSGNGQNPDSFQGKLEFAVLSKVKVFPMSGGKQIRDFLPIEDAAEKICQISLQTSIDGIVNCCSGNPCTLKEYAESYVHDSGSKMKVQTGVIPYRQWESMEQYGDTKKLEACLGYYRQLVT